MTVRNSLEPEMPGTAEGSVAGLLRLAVLLVCHNRRDQTLRALDALESRAGLATVPVVFDDASGDGTAEAVLAARPDTVMIRGNGAAFWNGGLHRAWTRALELPVDGFLWLNDDVVLDPDALARLAAVWRKQSARQDCFILVGATRAASGAQTYGGMRVVRRPQSIGFRMVPHGSELTPVDTFNGNIVLVPRSVTQRIGINDPRYFHNLGDVDYGLRARQAGIACFALPGTLGVCEGNAAKMQHGYGARALSWREQWRKVNTHHGLPPKSWLRFTRRHSGAWWPVHFLLPYRHLLKVWRR